MPLSVRPQHAGAIGVNQRATAMHPVDAFRCFAGGRLFVQAGEDGYICDVKPAFFETPEQKQPAAGARKHAPSAAQAEDAKWRHVTGVNLAKGAVGATRPGDHDGDCEEGEHFLRVGDLDLALQATFGQRFQCRHVHGLMRTFGFHCGQGLGLECGCCPEDAAFTAIPDTAGAASAPQESPEKEIIDFDEIDDTDADAGASAAYPRRRSSLTLSILSSTGVSQCQGQAPKKAAKAKAKPASGSRASKEKDKSRGGAAAGWEQGTKAAKTKTHGDGTKSMTKWEQRRVHGSAPDTDRHPDRRLPDGQTRTWVRLCKCCGRRRYDDPVGDAGAAAKTARLMEGMLLSEPEFLRMVSMLVWKRW